MNPDLQFMCVSIPYVFNPHLPLRSHVLKLLPQPKNLLPVDLCLYNQAPLPRPTASQLVISARSNLSLFHLCTLVDLYPGLT